MSAKKLESYKVYLKLASDLDSTEPVISLCCRLFYVDRFMALKKQMKEAPTAEEQKELGALLAAVEDSKKNLNMSKEEMKEALEDYCKRNFAAIDKEDRTAPKIGKEHAKRFIATAYLIELLGFYNAMTPKWDEISMLMMMLNMDSEVLQAEECDDTEVFEAGSGATKR